MFLPSDFFNIGMRRSYYAAVIEIFFCLVACQPESVRQEKVLRRQVVHELRNRSYVTAAPLARQLTQRAPQDQRAWKYLLQAQLGLHDTDGARQTLSQWRKTVASPNARADEFEGDIFREEHNFAGALLAWQKVAEAEPKNRRVRDKIAMLQQNERHWNDAEAAWTDSLEIKESATARVNRAVCRRRLHKWPAAFDDLHRAQQLTPEDPDVRRWTKIFEGLSKFIEQISEFDAKLALVGDDVGLLCDRALLFLRSGDFELALDDAEKAGKLASWAVRPKLFEAIALIALGRGQEAERLSVRRPVRLESLSPEFLESISRLDAAIAVERTNPEHFIARSWHLNEIGQPTLALQDAETALRLDAKSAAALTELSYALAKLGRLDEAVSRITQATELESNSAPAWQYRGELEMARGKYLVAVDSLSRAIGIHQSIAAFQKREECYRRLGLQTRADEDRRAIEKLMASAMR